MRLVTAYQCVRSEQTTNTVFQQQKRHFEKLQQPFSCPRRMFRDDLTKFVTACKKKDITVILGIDANENMTDGKLAKQLQKARYKELYKDKFPDGEVPKSWFRGSSQIDGIWIPSHLTRFNIALLTVDVTTIANSDEVMGY